MEVFFILLFLYLAIGFSYSEIIFADLNRLVHGYNELFHHDSEDEELKKDIEELIEKGGIKKFNTILTVLCVFGWPIFMLLSLVDYIYQKIK